MLYHLHEFQKAASFSAHEWSMATRLFFDVFNVKNTLVGNYLNAGNEIIERATRDFEKPAFNLNSYEYNIHGKSFQGTVTEKIIKEFSFMNLLHFKRENAQGDQFGSHHPNVLLVAPLSGHFATLLRDTVKTFLPKHNVYITDWKNARDVSLSEGIFTLENYVDVVIKCIEALKGDVHIVAICQPVVPVLMAVAHLATNDSAYQPKSMTLMGGPVDARVNPGKVNEFGANHTLQWFKNNIVESVPLYYAGAGRQVCPGFIMLDGFMALNIDRHRDASFALFKNLVKGDLETVEHHNAFYNEYRSVMDVPAEYYLDSIEKVFQKFLLPRGKMRYKGKRIMPELIKKTPLLTIEGEKDDISCVGQTFAAHHLCKGLSDDQKYHYVQEEVGHYGIFNGKRFRKFIYPKMAQFIKNSDK